MPRLFPQKPVDTDPDDSTAPGGAPRDTPTREPALGPTATTIEDQSPESPALRIALATTAILAISVAVFSIAAPALRPELDTHTGDTDEAPVSGALYANAEACVAAGENAESCASAFATALALHRDSAPVYSSLSACISVHGEAQCGPHQIFADNPQSAAFFTPIFAGYVMGRMLGSQGQTRLVPQPLYARASGGYQNRDGAFTTPRVSGPLTANVVRDLQGPSAQRPTNISPMPGNSDAAFAGGTANRTPSVNVAKSPVPATTTVSRGGFGASPTSSGSSGRGFFGG